MTYELNFIPQALKEWKKLNPVIASQFKAKLNKRLQNPEVEKDKLRGELKACYKIKLRQSGYRLVYQIKKNEVVILVLSVGKREASEAYKAAAKRLN